NSGWILLYPAGSGDSPDRVRFELYTLCQHHSLDIHPHSMADGFDPGHHCQPQTDFLGGRTFPELVQESLVQINVKPKAGAVCPGLFVLMTITGRMGEKFVGPSFPSPFQT